MDGPRISELETLPSLDRLKVRIYADSASYTYEKLPSEDVVTPEMARQQLAPLLERATLD